jgi:nucleoside-diphosphate-sugar epimerase
VENGGIATRDFIYVDDIVRGLMLCAVLGGAGEVFNLASGVETSILDLATIVNELTGNPIPIQLGPKRDWDHSGKRFGSTTKAQRVLDFQAQVNFQAGLAHTIAWTRQNLAFIEACIQKHRDHLPGLELAYATGQEIISR